MFVARFSDNPKYDIQRGWSGWMGLGWTTQEDAIEDLIELGIADPDVRYDENAKVWRHVHHEGISCFALWDAETVEEAIAEAQARNLRWEGWGQATTGLAKLVCAVPGVDNLYIFECEDAASE